MLILLQKEDEQDEVCILTRQIFRMFLNTIMYRVEHVNQDNPSNVLFLKLLKTLFASVISSMFRLP